MFDHISIIIPDSLFAGLEFMSFFLYNNFSQCRFSSKVIYFLLYQHKKSSINMINYNEMQVGNYNGPTKNMEIKTLVV